MKFTAEYTDTFSGEANYSWVHRETFEAPDNTSDRALMMRARKLIGLTGMRGRTSNIGETLEFRPDGCCTVLFVTPNY